MRADNQGEGGILALLALVLRQMPVQSRWRATAIGFGLVGDFKGGRKGKEKTVEVTVGNAADAD